MKKFKLDFNSKYNLQTFLFFIPALILMIIFIFGPVIAAFSFSFTNLQLTGSAALNTKFIGLDNYARALTDSRFYTSLLRTLVFLIFSSFIGQQVLGFTVALLMKSRNKIIRRFTGSCILAGWVCPEVVVGMCFVAFYSRNGVLDGIFSFFGLPSIPWLLAFPMVAVIVANIWRGTAFSMLMFQAALDKISPSIIEAADIDGAKGWHKLFFITIPMLKRDILTNMILNTLSTLGVFGMIFMITRGGPGNETQVLSIFMYEQAFIRYQLGYGTAISVIALIIGLSINYMYLRLLRVNDLSTK